MTTPTAEPLPRAPDPATAFIEAHLADPRMRAATDDGRYGVTDVTWPVVTSWVAVGGGRLGLRLDCSGYPAQAPAGCPWDLDSNTPLPPHRWPVDGRPPGVFRLDWSPANHNAPYLACDRVGLATHPGWLQEVPHRAWTSAKTLGDYLEQVHEALIGAVLPAEPS